ncbi:Hvo_1808 family surface protein [Halorubellus sp. PRR65]|uniref:Hvo_1808 family surface protein n=1 Tax=Halorubellus sp. PRR65 TaxID=3098148 RepID=UPI002B25E550|nr:Hvo_1808 family surface protein [Halorubellus sp. PRR65]
MRTRVVLVVLAVVAVVGLAGCTLSAFDEPTATSDSETAPAPEDGGGLADPETDVKGWENGVWYNESLAVTPGDGLNETELAAVVNRSMARVEYVRNVEFDRRVPVSILSREEYRDRQGGGGGDGEETAAAREAARLEALFLVGESTDAQEEQAETRSASVQGFYSSGEDEITIVAPSATPTVDEVTLAHELVHAYQFRGNLDVRFPRSPTRDERRALFALIEGDANHVDRQVRQRCGSEWACVGHEAAADASTSDGGTTADGDGSNGGAAAAPRPNMGLYLLSYFPYAEGERYVAERKDAGGWAAVNALYSDPAASSEQVIHRNDDSVASVSVPDRSTSEWSRVGDGVVAGEADVATMFAATLYDDVEGSVVSREQFLTDGDDLVPIRYALPPSAGWAGDSLYAYERADGDAGYVWRLRFDDDGEAREFASAYRDLLRYRGAERDGSQVFVVPDGSYADAFYVDVSGSRVTIVNAPTVEDLGDVHGPASQRVAAATALPAPALEPVDAGGAVGAVDAVDAVDANATADALPVVDGRARA